MQDPIKVFSDMDETAEDMDTPKMEPDLQQSLGHTIDLERIEILTGGVTEGYLQQNSLLS